MDMVGVIESAYRTELSEAEWLSEVARAARPHLDAGFGVATWTFDARDLTRTVVMNTGFAGDDPGVLTAMAAASEAAGRQPRDFRAAAHANGPCQTVSEVVGTAALEVPELRVAFAPYDVHDMMGVVGADPTGFGLGVGAALRAPRRATRAEVRQWSRVAAHLAAGFRLRRTIDTRPVEAIVTPDGKVAHAESAAKSSDALETLRRAAISVDRARGRLRREDCDEAIEIWRGLISGRWSLVEQFESDGRRLLVARQNDPETPFPPNLTMRERQVLIFRMLGHPLKLIAYELGLSISTVSSTLQGALRKLGVSSIADVIRMLMPGAEP